MKCMDAGNPLSFCTDGWVPGDCGRRRWVSWAAITAPMPSTSGDLGNQAKRETYAVNDFVSLVDQFMEQLGIASAPLVGHSMGGTVSLSVAIRYPERVNKVVVVGSPIVGSSLAPLLKIAGYRPSAFLLFNMMGPFRYWMKSYYARVICSDPRFPDMMDRDLSRTTLEILPALDRFTAPYRPPSPA